ncbi:hypothetical protein BZ164_20510 [Pseudomonas veronii]|nr:hypothetical protein BZ164_20510 [Pseudomonas veronii]
MMRPSIFINAGGDDVTFSLSLQGFWCRSEQFGHPFFSDLIVTGLIAQLFGYCHSCLPQPIPGRAELMVIWCPCRAGRQKVG